MNIRPSSSTIIEAMCLTANPLAAAHHGDQFRRVRSKKTRTSNRAPAAHSPTATDASRAQLVLTCAGLVAITLVAYSSIGNLGFVGYDDDEYIKANPNIAAGLTWSGVKWAFTTGYFANWHPLTWLSHMLDIQLFGMNPGAHHAVNLLLHMVSTLLLFGVLVRMTAAVSRSAFVAALFAVHPLHVESVAWAAERKDALSTLLWMLTLWAYVDYTKNSSWKRYCAVAAFLALGLMAKPMLVTLPVVLLLLDVWPLQRVRRATLITEKLPLFVLVGASSLVTLIVQRQGGTVMQFSQVPFGLRIANALVAYVRYIGKMLWPVDLVAMYPLPREIPGTAILFAAIVMLGVTALVLLAARSHPYLLVGWLWYVVTLAPVIGIIQVGAQAMADRYTYVPLVGLFLIIAWGVPEALAALPRRQSALHAASAAATLACVALSYRQVQYWRSGLALWRHAVDATPDNYFAQGSLGYVLWKDGKTDEAMPHYIEALRLRPDFAEGHNNIGVALAGQGRLREAIPHFSEAVRLKPGYVVAQQNLDATTARVGTVDGEFERFADAVREKPNDLAAHNEYGAALSSHGRIDEAIEQFSEALRIDPSQPDVHYNLGMMLDKKGRDKEAAAEFRAALRTNPKHEPARQALNAILSRSSARTP